MNLRKMNKDASYKNIIKAAAVRLRVEGLSGAGLSSIMKDAGLTHGAFYSHFSSKEQLIAEAFEHALNKNRPRWINPAQKESWTKRLKHLAKRYLTGDHRDDLSNGCALAAFISDAARANTSFQKLYEKELYNTINAICGDPETCATQNKFDEALMFMALCIGGISLSRAVDDKQLSERILYVCRTASERLSFRQRPVVPDSEHMDNKAKDTKSIPILNQFPIKTYEKLRYADMDLHGHVNNAVFSTMLETGRVEILYDSSRPLTGENSSFVIAHQSLDFLSEITWPGQVEIGTKIVSIGGNSVIFRRTHCFKLANASQPQRLL